MAISYNFDDDDVVGTFCYFDDEVADVDRNGPNFEVVRGARSVTWQPTDVFAAPDHVAVSVDGLTTGGHWLPVKLLASGLTFDEAVEMAAEDNKCQLAINSDQWAVSFVIGQSFLTGLHFPEDLR
jgi:hypothetical protein